jgi:RNA polymerase primary sigma factor
MKITAVTRFKQGDIWQALQRLGWTQSELARRTKLSATTIGDIVNMRIQREHMSEKRLRRCLDSIQKALASLGEYLDVMEMWPKEFRGFDKALKVETTMEVPLDRLLYAQHARELQEFNDPVKSMERQDMIDGVHSAISTLSEREQIALKHRFFENKTLRETSDAMGVSRERLRQMEAKTMRKLRHPSRAKKLMEFVFDD